MKNRIKFTAAAFAAVFALSGLTAFAQSTETTNPTPTPGNEIVIEDNRTLTPKGNAELVDDVTDNENLQFITVTAKDGNVFYFVIDKGTQSENVYFLNTVDETDLAALTKEDMKAPEPQTSASPEPEQKTEPEQPVEQQKTNNTTLYIILALAAVGIIGGYYYKVILPKKKLEQADDIEDFEFEDAEETVSEDETEEEFLNEDE